MNRTKEVIDLAGGAVAISTDCASCYKRRRNVAAFVISHTHSCEPSGLVSSDASKNKSKKNVIVFSFNGVKQYSHFL